MYEYYNNNPLDKDIADCVVRAISLAEGISWRDCQRKLSNIAREQGQMIDSVEFAEDYLDERYPRQCHYSKTLEEFINEHKHGIYVVTMQNHITCVIDGVCYDTFNPTDRIIRCAWRIKK